MSSIPCLTLPLPQCDLFSAFWGLYHYGLVTGKFAAKCLRAENVFICTLRTIWPSRLLLYWCLISRPPLLHFAEHWKRRREFCCCCGQRASPWQGCPDAPETFHCIFIPYDCAACSDCCSSVSATRPALLRCTTRMRLFYGFTRHLLARLASASPGAYPYYLRELPSLPNS